MYTGYQRVRVGVKGDTSKLGSIQPWWRAECPRRQSDWVLSASWGHSLWDLLWAALMKSWFSPDGQILQQMDMHSPWRALSSKAGPGTKYNAGTLFHFDCFNFILIKYLIEDAIKVLWALTFLFLKACRARYPLHVAWKRVMLRLVWRSLCSSSLARTPALKKTCMQSTSVRSTALKNTDICLVLYCNSHRVLSLKHIHYNEHLSLSDLFVGNKKYFNVTCK